MKREMTFCKKSGKKIRGMLFLPEETDRGMAGKLPLVIFSHGFGSNFRELMHHGEGFAESGLCCLFFDFCGGGTASSSDGTMQEMTILSECEDLQTVITCVKELDYVDPERIFLQGESMGGLVSALVAARHPQDIRAMVLWYPALGIPDDARIRVREGRHEVFGLSLSETFDIDAMEIDVYTELQAYDKPMLIIHGTADNIVPIRYSERAAAVWADARLKAMPGAGHGFDGPDSIAARELSVSFILQYC